MPGCRVVDLRVPLSLWILAWLTVSKETPTPTILIHPHTVSVSIHHPIAIAITVHTHARLSASVIVMRALPTSKPPQNTPRRLHIREILTSVITPSHPHIKVITRTHPNHMLISHNLNPDIDYDTTSNRDAEEKAATNSYND